MATAQQRPQHLQHSPQHSSSTLWENRQSAFVPPTRMSQPPIRQFSSDNIREQVQSQPPPTQDPPKNANRSSSFFSFGRSHKSSQSVSSVNSSRLSAQQPNTQSRQSVDMNGANQSGAYAPPQHSQLQSQPPYPQQPPPPDQPPPPPPHDSQENANGNGSRLSTTNGAAPTPPPLHPELRSFVSLSFAHVHKIYFSGPLVRKVERTPDGGKAKDDLWADVWAQLGGTTLSIWEMKEIERANKEGREVPPSYINVTDAFVSVLGSITVPPQGNIPPKRYTNVLTLNTAGSNLLLFACPDANSLVSWAAALRLAAWEKSRLEEIYTAHLLRMTLSDGGAWREPKTTLVKGQMEGWAQIRIAGQTGWKRMWLVLSAATQQSSSTSQDGHGSNPPTLSKRRISNLFGGGNAQPVPVIKSSLALYTTPKMKDKKRPWLTIYDITQAFSVYPERPEMISRSTLIKVEGSMSDEEGAGNMKGREAWILVMPEVESGGNGTPGRQGVMEMLKWIVGLHDAFELYGRPRGYTWDPRDHISAMFAYPFGPLKDHLFLDRELAENLDPREERTSVIRSRLLNVLVERMQGPPVGDMEPPRQPQINTFGPRQGQSLLTPITERSSIPTRENTIDGHLDSLNSPAESDSRNRSISGVMSASTGNQSPLPASPGLAAAILAVTSGGGGSVPATPPMANAVAPAEPPAPTRPSQAFETHLSPIASAPTSPPITTDSAAPQLPPSGASPRLPSINASVPAQPSLDTSALSPRAFAERAWSDATSASGAPQIGGSLSARGRQTPEQLYASPSSIGAHQNVPFNPPGRNAASPSPERPPSINTQPRAPSPLRASTQGSLPQQQRVTSPLAKSPILPPIATQQQQLAPTPGPPDSQSTTPYGDELPPMYGNDAVYPGPLQEKFTPEKKEVPRQEMPQQSPVSTYSYPAGAEMQTPDLHEPQPKPSRESHSAVLNAPYMSPAGSANVNLPGPSQSPRAAPASPGTPVSRPRDLNMNGQDQYGRQAPLSSQRSPPTSPPRQAQWQPHSPQETSPASQRTVEPQVRPLPSNVPFDAKPAVPGVRASQVHIQRRPSGARAPPAKKYPAQVAPSIDLHSVKEDQDTSPGTSTTNLPPIDTSSSVKTRMDDYGADALAALSLADQIDHPQPAAARQTDLPPPPPIPAAQAINRTASPVYPSSFGQNKAAAERKAKAQAQQVAAQQAASKPGRAGKKKPKAQGAWKGSSDEEEEDDDDEEDDDEDEDSDGPARSRSRPPPAANHYQNSSAGMPPSGSQAFYDPRRVGSPAARLGTPPTGRPLPSPDYASQRGRGLPNVPNAPSPGPRDVRGQGSYDENSYARRGHFEDARPDELGQQQSARAREMPPQLQKSVWSRALDPDRDANPGRDTFVKVEDESVTMTKVFAPQGLLQAGLQDKHDRSAKRQEELARESGSSLINVPGKPLEPQTGLLGAVTAHERDRKRDGGVGATLTRKLAEERQAEERQRKIDDLQRQQLEYAQANGGGSMYGGFGGEGQFNPMMTPGGGQYPYNPMMLNPMMMMGNPMMGMGWGGMTPQQMMAQQAAAEAYQRAMITFSQAGSVPGSAVPSEAGDVSPGAGSGIRAISPMPTGGMGMMNPMMSGMGGMGMMGNPMMMNPMMTGMSGMMGTPMGGMGSPMGGMGTPSMYGGPSFGAQGIPTPSTDVHNSPGRFSGFHNPSPDHFPVDRSAAASQNSNRAPSPNPRMNPN